MQHGVKPVGNREYRRGRKRRPERLLDQGVRSDVDGRRRLVQDEYLGILQQRPGEAEQLPLPDGEVDAGRGRSGRGAVGFRGGGGLGRGGAGPDRRVEVAAHRLYDWLQVGLLQRLPDRLVALFVERVQI